MNSDYLLRQRSVASIPSKFETVLHQGNQEQNAFWSRTHRFRYNDNELPGPGTYVAAARPGEAPSFSKKGYTGMASKSRRFAAPRRNRAPPPGTYEPDAGFRALFDKKSFSAALSTAPFTKPVVTADHQVSRKKGEVVPPGPGHYSAREAGQEEKRAKGRAVPFNSGAERFRDKGGAEDEESAPAPGAYDYEAINRQTGAFQAVSREAPSAAFRSSSRRLPGASADADALAALKPHPSMGPSLGIQVEIKKEGPSLAQPGPGAYEPHLAEQLLTLDKIRHSSMFSRTNLDRFGKPFVAKAAHLDTPGPGYYQKLAGGTHPSRAEASQAAFVSTTERHFGEGARGAPGPAYYNPAPPSKKSFHLNASKRWL